MFQIIIIIFSFLLIQCQSKPTAPLKQIKNSNCLDLEYLVENAEVDLKFDAIAEMYPNKCYNNLIKSGKLLRKENRDKFYSMTSEISEVFFPEGSMTEYIPESYERAYLSLLMSLSYYQLKNIESARIEFLRSVEESNAILYNYGTDPTILVLQASIADSIPLDIDSRPFWKKITELKNINTQITDFALQRIADIDNHVIRKFRIIYLGAFPEIDWQPNFLSTDASNYEITSKEQFPNSCYQKESASLFLSTESWYQKLTKRYDKDYHPLLNAKSWVRLPVGIAYGAAAVTLGTSIAVSGCAIASSNNNGGGGPLCEAAIQTGGTMIASSANIVSYTLKPDMRHWKNLPLAFYITDSTKKIIEYDEICWNQIPSKIKSDRYNLLRTF